MTKVTGETYSDASRTEDSEDVGQRYRFEHLALLTVLGDMYFSRHRVARLITGESPLPIRR